MPFVQNFTVSSLFGNPGTLVFEDTSTGSDSGIVEKRIFLEKQNGEFLTPVDSTTDYIVWPTATNPFYLDILDKDYALSIRVDWSDGDPDYLLINDTDVLLINSTDKFLL